MLKKIFCVQKQGGASNRCGHHLDLLTEARPSSNNHFPFILDTASTPFPPFHPIPNPAPSPSPKKKKKKHSHQSSVKGPFLKASPMTLPHNQFIYFFLKKGGGQRVYWDGTPGSRLRERMNECMKVWKERRDVLH